MKENIRRNIELAVLFGLICAIALSFARFEVRCDDLRQNVLRLHIIANSDSEEDQTLKLAVRDAILENSSDIFKNCNSIDDACNTAQSQIDTIGDIANSVIEQNDVEYKAAASVGDSFFDTRVYDDFTLPAGTYKSLIINLGEGEGKNWWCVIFPTICVPAASDTSLSDSVSDSAAQAAENAPKYKIRFKTIEIYEKIKKIFSKNA